MSIPQGKADVYQQITNAIIDAIEEGTPKFEMPWHSLSTPVNATSHKPYRGLNILMLWAAARKRAYSSQEWATYRQWQELGAQVRKGERSTAVVFWKFYGHSEEQQDEADVPEDRVRCFARCYSVFNAAQVDGYTPPMREQLPEKQRIEKADRFFGSPPGIVKHGGDRAFYSPGEDFIQMPRFAQFTSPEAYVSTLAHEYTHWTGAASRLHRDLASRFGSERYAAEELIAELGASFLCAELEIPSEPRTDHAPYIASRIRVLRKDKRAIFTAASKAQEAAIYLQQIASLAQERAS